ncbi:hypothetical protein FN846DRAFT_3234 [Sphaerosporella brunnea]|uniref:Uncharacterized protein n=1 Tax=Sphaerosporella brunnea TaxID=1250544 RepID=A0A5J5FCD0_9PEZI|nr:hypothetical protein FN846DRAFT_3234 [Sphaerosporella brunnea]
MYTPRDPNWASATNRLSEPTLESLPGPGWSVYDTWAASTGSTKTFAESTNHPIRVWLAQSLSARERRSKIEEVLAKVHYHFPDLGALTLQWDPTFQETSIINWPLLAEVRSVSGPGWGPIQQSGPNGSQGGDDEKIPRPKQSYSQRATRHHLKLWYQILPWIYDHMEEIIGEGNTGGVNFMPTAKDPRPIIRIFASHTKPDTGQILRQKIAEDENLKGRFILKVEEGSVQRSCPRERPKPTCGADIGICEQAALRDFSLTFGGYICLEFEDSPDAIYGLSCHHLVQAEPSSSPQKNEGVKDGLFNGKEFLVCQPSVARGMQDFLNGRSRKSGVKKFGRVAFSSGYQTKSYENIAQLPNASHEVDWAIFENIPHTMMGENWLPSMNPEAPPKQPLGLSTREGFVDYMKLTTVDDAVNPLEGEDSEDLFGSPEYKEKRVYGLGGTSGWGEGIISEVIGPIYWGDGRKSMEATFTPSNSGILGLGISGDSGAWIFSKEGLLVGMIIGCITNSKGKILSTIFTPIHAIIEGIREKTGAVNVRLLHVSDYKTFNECHSRLQTWSKIAGMEHRENPVKKCVGPKVRRRKLYGSNETPTETEDFVMSDV